MNARRSLAPGFVIAWALAACSGAQASHEESASPPPPIAAAEPSHAITDDDDAPPPRAPGPLTRAEVDQLVARGLGALLATVRVTPVFVQSRFAGFRLDAARDLDAWHAAGADVQLGDVIVRINGIRIERPEHALWAFEQLRIARAIEVDVLRAGAPCTIHSPIVGAVVEHDG